MWNCLKDANGKANGSGALVAEFMGMGFPKEMILKAIKEIGNDNNNLVLLFASGCILNLLFQLLSFLSGDTDTEQLLELLLTYQVFAHMVASLCLLLSNALLYK